MTRKTALAALFVLGFVAFGCNSPTPTAPEVLQQMAAEESQSLDSVSAPHSTSGLSSGQCGDAPSAIIVNPGEGEPIIYCGAVGGETPPPFVYVDGELVNRNR